MKEMQIEDFVFHIWKGAEDAIVVIRRVFILSGVLVGQLEKAKRFEEAKKIEALHKRLMEATSSNDLLNAFQTIVKELEKDYDIAEMVLEDAKQKEQERLEEQEEKFRQEEYEFKNGF